MNADKSIIIECVRAACGQKLRVPTNKGNLKLTCPRCHATWDYENSNLGLPWLIVGFLVIILVLCTIDPKYTNAISDNPKPQVEAGSEKQKEQKSVAPSGHQALNTYWGIRLGTNIRDYKNLYLISNQNGLARYSTPYAYYKNSLPNELKYAKVTLYVRNHDGVICGASVKIESDFPTESQFQEWIQCYQLIRSKFLKAYPGRITEKSEAVFGGAIDNSGQKLVIIGYLFGEKYRPTMINIQLLDTTLAKDFNKDLDTTGY